MRGASEVNPFCVILYEVYPVNRKCTSEAKEAKMCCSILQDLNN